MAAPSPRTPTRKPILNLASSSKSYSNSSTPNDSPTTATSPTPSQTQHTYTSLSSLRRAEAEARAKGETPPRDRKNGFHLWTVEEQGGVGSDVERQGGRRRSSAVPAPVLTDEPKKIGQKRMSQWQLVSPRAPPLAFEPG